MSPSKSTKLNKEIPEKIDSQEVKPPRFKIYQNIIPGPNPPERIYAIIEIPKGSQNKYELSKNTNLLLLNRVLHSSVIYPQDYGFIPGTLADDDDPLDVLVLISHPTYPRTLVECKPIGVLVMEDEKGIDYKILAVAMEDPSYNSGYDDVIQLPHHCLDEIKEFFRTYKNLENPKYSAVKEWRGREYAYNVIEESIKMFKKKYGDIAKIDPVAEVDLDT